MIALLLAALATDSATLCVRDAATGAPVIGVQAVDSIGHVRTVSGGCGRIPVGSHLLRRIGYESLRVVLAESPAGTVARLKPRTSPLTVIATYNVSADVREPGIPAHRGLARTLGSTDVGRAREMGVGTVSGLVATLPYAAPRSARGELNLSLRGARREAVAVTLDGLPLNDPATGVADVSDLPLVMLGSASVALGSDPMGAGSGASGGVLALHSAARRVVAIRAGAFGQQSAEAAWHGTLGGRVAYAALGYRRADNDFAFENDAAPGGAVTEQRVNNDERRAVAAFGLSGEHVQTLALVSGGERGMVGAANVRAYDNDRARTTRLLLRSQAWVGGVGVVAGVRGIELGYRDPTRPELDTRSRAGAADVEVRGVRRQLSWRAGAGADRVYDAADLDQARARGFAALSRLWRAGRNAVDVGARLDAVGTLGMMPSFSAAGQRRLIGESFGGPTGLQVGARVAQAVRVPTLYDLYFSSPQRLFVRTLRPERVSLDAEINGSGSLPTALGVLGAHAALVARDTRDAIIWFPGNFGWSPANVGMERLRGAEARLSLESEGLSVSAWGTAYDTELVTGPLRIPTPYVARFSGGGQALVKRGPSSASAIVRGAGRRPFTAGPRNPAFELPGTVLVDLGLSRRFSVKPFAVRTLAATDALVALSLENATGLSWQSVRGFPAPGRAWAINITLSPASNP